MSSLTFALGAALYHDHSFVDDVGPLRAFLDSLHGSAIELVQFAVPVGPRKGRPPTPYRVDALLARVREGKLFSLRVETPPRTPDDEVAAVGVQSAPVALIEEAARRRGYRYVVDVACGPRALERLGASDIVSSIVALADAVSARAGVIFTAEGTSFAGALASGASVGSLTEDQDRRVRDAYYSVAELKGRLRGPEWGTFLASEHVERAGGLPRIEAEAGCARVVPLSSGGAFLQLTDEPPAPDDPELAERREALARFLAPVLA